MLLASWHAAHSPSRGPAPARPYGPRVVRPSQIHTPRRSTQRLDRATRGRGCYQPPRHGGQTHTGGLRAARDAVAVFLVPPCSTDGAAGIGQLARGDLWMVDAGGSGPARAGLRGTLATISSPGDPALTKLASPGRDIIQVGYNIKISRGYEAVRVSPEIPRCSIRSIVDQSAVSACLTPRVAQLPSGGRATRGAARWVRTAYTVKPHAARCRSDIGLSHRRPASHPRAVSRGCLGLR